jgi:Lon protease-like protein
MSPPALEERAYPVLATSQLVLFPAMRCTVGLANARALLAIEAALRSSGGLIAVLMSGADSRFEPAAELLHAVGSVGRALSLGWRSCCGRWVVELEGVARVRRSVWLRHEPFREGRFAHLPEPDDPSLPGLALAIHAVARSLRQSAPRCVHTRRAVERLAEVVAPAELPGAASELLFHLPARARQCLLETEPLSARLEMTVAALHERLAQMAARRPT